MTPKIEIRTRRLVLRPLNARDVTKAYVDGLNNPDVNNFLVDVKRRKQTPAGVRRFVRSNALSRDAVFYGIFLRGGGLIGTVRAYNISLFHFICTVGICLFDKGAWGKGYGTEALKGVCGDLFKRAGLRYIEAYVYARNKASLRLFKKAGFKAISGIKNKYRYGTGFQDVVLYGLINRSFDMRLLKRDRSKK